MRSINGKKDATMGCTEKVMWYDSANRNHVGGACFFDMREHDGTGRTWDGLKYNLYRYAKNLSYPAFSYCSTNEDPGSGHADSGAAYGSVNGFLEWSDDIVDSPDRWEIKIFMKDLTKVLGGIEVAPDSCTAWITPRRLQKFKPQPGTTVYYAAIHHGDTAFHDSFTHDGTLLTVPDVPISAKTPSCTRCT